MDPTNPTTPLSLVADIGGTNTRVALANGPALLPETMHRYRNAEHSGLDAILTAYLDDHAQTSCAAASVAIAGPVRDGRGTLTNLDWTIGPEMLREVSGAATVAVLNDLQAQGHALGRIADENLRSVIDGPAPRPDAAQIVIGVGTGFNIAPVHTLGEQRLVPAAEAGHVSLPVRSPTELKLAESIEKAHGFAAVEDVLSGRGLERVYAWCSEQSGTPNKLDAATIMARLEDGADPVAIEAVSVFVGFFGRVAGDLALDHLPLGGVYLSGGVSRAMAPYFGRFGFAEAFRDKGRFSDLMNDFSVKVIEDDFAALTGTAANLAMLTSPQRSDD